MRPMDFFSEVQKVTEAHCAVMGYSSTPLVFKVAGEKFTAVVSSVEDAVAKWNDYRDRCLQTGAGPDEFGHGGRVMHGRKVIAKIAYNGRVMP